MSDEIIEHVSMKCSNCGGRDSYMVVSEGPKGKFRVAYCHNCDSKTYEEITPNQDYIEPKHTPTVTCPYCSSTNCKKISGASKVGKVLMWGVLAAGSVGHTWHCNSCGSNFG